MDVEKVLARSTNFDAWRNGSGPIMTCAQVLARVRESPGLASVVRLQEESAVSFEDFMSALMETSLWFDGDSEGPYTFDDVREAVARNERLADSFHVVSRLRLTYRVLFM